MSYAAETRVPISRSQEELKKILSKYGASGFVYGETTGQAVVMFEMAHRRVKFILPMPKNPTNEATKASITTFEQLCRSRWRCLCLAVKAKLECVESGITTLEQEFLAHIVLPNGKTMGDAVIPQIASAYQSGKMPPMLGFGG